MKFCNQAISKTDTTKSFKVGQLIEDNVDYLVKIKKKLIFFWSYCPLQISALKTCIKDEKFCHQDV